MRPSASPALRALYHHSYPQACRFVAGRRFALSYRSFLTTPRHANQDDPTKGSEGTWNHLVEEPPGPYRSEMESKEVEEVVDHADGGPYIPSKPIDKSNYGSAARRAGRNIKKVKEVPQLQVPKWFLDDNVSLRELIPDQIKVRHVRHKRLGTSPTEQESPMVTPSGEKNGEAEDPNIGVRSRGTVLIPTEERPLSLSPDSQPGEGVEESITKVQIDTSDPPKGEEFYEIQGDFGKYEIDANIMDEISSMVAAGLNVPPAQYADEWTSSKPHLVLYCPIDGGTFFLDGLVKCLASVNGADLIRLDPQDIAEIGGSYLEERRDTHTRSLSSLGYDAYRASSEQASLRDSQGTEDPAEEEEYEEFEEDFRRNRPKSSIFGSPRIGVIPIAQFSGNIGELLKSAITGAAPSSNPTTNTNGKAFVQTVDITNDLMMSQFIETILGASELKRLEKDHKVGTDITGLAAESTAEVADKVNATITENTVVHGSLHEGGPYTKSLIILIRDYPEINTTYNGAKVLDRLHEIVKRRRKEGQRVLVVGTSASKGLLPTLSKSSFHRIQSEPDNGPTRTLITPCRPRSRDALLRDHRLRTAMINLRNLQNMLHRIAPAHIKIDLMSINALESQLLGPLDQMSSPQTMEFVAALPQYIWSLDFIHHVATVTLGLHDGQETLGPEHVVRALHMVSLSDNAKIEWMDHEKQQEKDIATPFTKPPCTPLSSEASEERMKKLRKICNTHEKKLLNGVIDADSIRTTFADVRAPPETIEALKTLTSLSLARPDAFTYGVLATDKIPGLLLYGPPGTGKTLLAKAVAKESGATVLEVSGSDVYDMYVGEGEKNVKAIFSLAKKLTPCVVFIDEADAILGSRGGSSHRSTHRELINQFLREWDGMNELSAFIMVATNRPFDLDEACLRRLPRRLLVDLPTETDREAILRIHLKDERLDPAVSLSTLASQTPFYSGSDLKNLAVAAALACVREELEQANSAAASSITESSPLPPSSHLPVPSPSSSSSSTTSSSEESPPPTTIPSLNNFKYPPRRTLSPRHFVRAMEEISASISEDMGSLSAIRKFDEKFGDRRGRRKRLGGGGYGFGTASEGEADRSDNARVRHRNRV